MIVFVAPRSSVTSLLDPLRQRRNGRALPLTGSPASRHACDRLSDPLRAPRCAALRCALALSLARPHRQEAQ